MPCMRPGCTCEDAPLRRTHRSDQRRAGAGDEAAPTYCSPDCEAQARGSARTGRCGCRHPECVAAHPRDYVAPRSGRPGVR